jgi:SPP1 family predicted phage head-tail adaptor
MTSPVTIGDLRHRVTIESETRVSDGGGGASVSWTLVADVWAAIRAQGGSESLDLDRVVSAVPYDIWIRYRTGVVPAMRVRFGTRVFDIRTVTDIEDRGHWLKLAALERDL